MALLVYSHEFKSIQGYLYVASWLWGQEALGFAYFKVEALPNGRKRSEPEVPWRQMTRTRTQWHKGCFGEALVESGILLWYLLLLEFIFIYQGWNQPSLLEIFPFFSVLAMKEIFLKQIKMAWNPLVEVYCTVLCLSQA